MPEFDRWDIPLPTEYIKPCPDCPDQEWECSVMVKKASKYLELHGFWRPSEYGDPPDPNYETGYPVKYLVKTTDWEKDDESGTYVETYDEIEGTISYAGDPPPSGADATITFSSPWTLRSLIAYMVANPPTNFASSWVLATTKQQVASLIVSSSRLGVTTMVAKYRLEVIMPRWEDGFPPVEAKYRTVAVWGDVPSDNLATEKEYLASEVVTETLTLHEDAEPGNNVKFVGEEHIGQLSTAGNSGEAVSVHVAREKSFPLFRVLASQSRYMGLRRNGFLAFQGDGVYLRATASGERKGADGALVLTYSGNLNIQRTQQGWPNDSIDYPYSFNGWYVWIPNTFSDNTPSLQTPLMWHPLIHPFWRPLYSGFEFISPTVLRRRGAFPEPWAMGVAQTDDLTITLSEEYTPAQLRGYVDAVVDAAWGSSLPGGSQFGQTKWSLLVTNSATRYESLDAMFYYKSRVRWRVTANALADYGLSVKRTVTVPIDKVTLDIASGEIVRTNADVEIEAGGTDHPYQELAPVNGKQIWFEVAESRWADFPLIRDTPLAGYSG